MSRPLKTCTFQETCGVNGVAAAPKPDPVVLDIEKGDNARYYRYAENVLRQGRLSERQNEITNCANDANCLIGARRSQVPRTQQYAGVSMPNMQIQQRLSVQPTFDAQGRPTNSMLTVGERSSIDYAAYHAEGQIKEARDRLNFLQGTQRFSRQCDLYGVLCGDESQLPAPTRPTGAQLDPAQADRPGTGYGGIQMIA